MVLFLSNNGKAPACQPELILRREVEFLEPFHRLLEIAEAFLKRKATIGDLRKAVAEAKKAQGGA